jgi:hypothetical protein
MVLGVVEEAHCITRRLNNVDDETSEGTWMLLKGQFSCQEIGRGELLSKDLPSGLPRSSPAKRLAQALHLVTAQP